MASNSPRVLRSKYQGVAANSPDVTSFAFLTQQVVQSVPRLLIASMPPYYSCRGLYLHPVIDENTF